MRKIIVLAILLWNVSFAIGQCPTENLVLTSQAEVDAFPIDYPNCTVLPQTLFIEGNDITDLSPLNQLVEIQGDLNVQNSPLLTDLTGLENLTTIEEDLIISGDGLTSVQGLESVSSIHKISINHSDVVEISSLGALTSLNQITLGFNDDLTTVSNLGTIASLVNLELVQNNALTDISGFSTLTEISNDLEIEYCAALTNVDAFSNITAPIEKVHLRHVDNLADISGFLSLTEISGSLYIDYCDVLTSLDGFSNIDPIEGAITIRNNLSLITIDDLPVATTISSLVLETNPLLTEIDAFSGITTITGSLSIFNTPMSDLSLLSSLSSVGSSFTVHDNLSLDGLESLTLIEGGSITLKSVTDLSAISNVSFTNTSLAVTLENLGASSLDGLQNLPNDIRFIRIKTSDNLTDISSLSNLNNTSLDVWIEDNDVLTNLDGLDNFVSAKQFRIINNDNLTDVSGLSSLTTAVDILQIEENDALPNLNGLENFTTTELVQIFNNNSLASISGLSGMTYLDYFHLNDCPIISIDGMQNVNIIDFAIFERTDLTNISELDDNVTINNNIIFRHNPSLSVCDDPAICNYIDSGGSPVFLNNDSGCNSTTEVTDACNTTCPTSDLVLSTQAQVNNFPTDYPGCTTLPVGLTIDGTNITDLSPLSVLTNINDFLVIQDNSALNDLSGLDNLQSIGSYLRIRNNDALSNLNELANLSSLGASINIEGNANLSQITGLEGLTAINGFFKIDSNPLLTNLSGLDNISSISSYFRIEDNAALTQVDALSNLTSIGNYFRIVDNSSLNSLSGFSGLTSIFGSLNVSSNGPLSSLSGLDNIDHTTIFSITLESSGMLSFCNVQSICDHLNSAGPYTISGNAAGCNNLLEVLDACNAPECPNTDITLSSQADIDNFSTNYPSCSTVDHDITITGTDITNLNGLSQLEIINGNLEINDNPALTSISGLSNLTTIDGNLEIKDNPLLASLNGLDALTTLDGNLKIENDDTLTDLSGLEGLTTIGGQLRIINNDNITSLTGLGNVTSTDSYVFISTNASLTSFTGLESLTIINGFFNINNNDDLTSISALTNLSTVTGYLKITGNAELVNLIGLENLTSIGGYLDISSNGDLTSLTGLDNLTSIGGDLTIKTNSDLTDLTALNNLTDMNGNIEVTSNNSLTSIDGIGNIDPIDIFQLTITNNTTLSSCDVASVCDLVEIEENWGNITISGNAFGCNSIEEVNDDCLGLLPIELSYFEVSKRDADNVLIEWETKFEINVLRFEIQSSINGENWQIIFGVDPLGGENIVQQYQKTDTPNTSALVIYYRLKTIDWDGSYAFSEIKSVDWDRNPKQAITVYPNPVSKNLWVQIKDSNSIQKIAIVNSTGQLIQVKEIDQAASEQHQIKIDTKQLLTGVYYLQVFSKNQMESIKFIKQDKK